MATTDHSRDVAHIAQEFGQLLVSGGLIERDDLDQALAEQRSTRERLGEILVRRGRVSAEDIIGVLSGQLGCDRFDPARDAVQPGALELVSPEFSRRHHVVPIRIDDTSFVVAMSDPLDVEALDHLRGIASNRGVELAILLATEETLARSAESHYGTIESNRNVSELITSVVDEIGETFASNEQAEDEAERAAQDAGVVKLVDQIMVQALRERATDIHIEPQERGLVIRYRVDGVLYDALTPPLAVYTGLVTRIKILSNMDIAERRAAQDGRFTHRADGREVDVRVSGVPTIHGEKLVLRLLDKSNFTYSLTNLGFSNDDHRAFVDAIRQPYGMVLLSGPTGSGKTTTLYTSLMELKAKEQNITTIEDPVEYQIGRINQIQVNERKNLTFATALRSFLRQDPDVIMVGEIRDRETAEIAIRASLTGHMVFSTIHANDAPTTATRLVSMGAEPFMTASALTMVAAQRLIRRSCTHCLEPYRPADDLLFALGDAAETLDRELLRGKGCNVCKGRGYQGRIAIIERMALTPAVRQLVAENRPANEIREAALADGMITLKRSGLGKVREGVTTVEEVLRVCLRDE